MNVTMTSELFKDGMSINGGWNRKQVECLGEGWPQKTGWRQRILSREYPEATIKRFLDLRTPDEKFSKTSQVNDGTVLLEKFKSVLVTKGVIAKGKASKLVRLMNSRATKSNWMSFLEKWEESGYPDFDVPESYFAKRAAAEKPAPTKPKPLTAKDAYDDYLAGDLWNAIRRYVLLAANHACKCCSRPANQVHHTSYDEMTMRGRDTSKLVAICECCHRDIHFDETGKKLTLPAANERLMEKLLNRQK